MNYTELISHLKTVHGAPAFVFDNSPEVVHEVHILDHEQRKQDHTHEDET